MSHKRQPVVITTGMLPGSRSFQCDCACVTSTVVHSSHAIRLSGQLRCADAYLESLPGGHTLIYNQQQGNGVAVVNQAALDLWRSFAESRVCESDEVPCVSSLLDAGALLPELETCLSEETSKSDTLSAWLHLTDRCNLRCSYCYLPHVNTTMSGETAEQAIDAVFRSAAIHGYSRVLLKYAGGEPLLVYPMLQKIQLYATAVAHRVGIALDSVVLSNGTLLSKEVIDFLKAHAVRLMISLDGLQAAHDVQRVYAGGRGTFSDVQGAIDLAQQNDLIPDISVTVTGANVGSLPELVEWLLKRQLPFSLNFYRECDLSVSRGELALEEERVIAGVLAAYRVIEANLPQYSLLDGLMDRANLALTHQHACGAGNDYLVFDPRGRVTKCQMAQDRPITTARVHDPLQELRSDRTGIHHIPVDEKNPCRSCDWRYSCAGGCPLMTFRATGRFDGKSPNCRIYQRLFPEALRLEGLRLVAHGIPEYSKTA